VTGIDRPLTRCVTNRRRRRQPSRPAPVTRIPLEPTGRTGELLQRRSVIALFSVRSSYWNAMDSSVVFAFMSTCTRESSSLTRFRLAILAEVESRDVTSRDPNAVLARSSSSSATIASHSRQSKLRGVVMTDTGIGHELLMFPAANRHLTGRIAHLWKYWSASRGSRTRLIV
jgi:hypothetical protein